MDWIPPPMNLDPKSVEIFLAADKAGKLSTRDRIAITKLRRSVAFSPEETLADMEQSLTEGNMMELMNAINGAPSEREKNILLAEKARLQNELNARAGVVSTVAPSLPKPSEESILDTIGNLLSKLWSTP